MDFFINGDEGYKMNIGDNTNGIKKLPIHPLFKVNSIDITSSYGSITIPAQGQKDANASISSIETDDGIFYPICVVGYDISMAYYCGVQKIYLASGSGSSKTLNIRLTNTSSSNYTTSRCIIYILYVQAECPWLIQ